MNKLIRTNQSGISFRQTKKQSSMIANDNEKIAIIKKLCTEKNTA